MRVGGKEIVSIFMLSVIALSCNSNSSSFGDVPKFDSVIIKDKLGRLELTSKICPPGTMAIFYRGKEMYCAYFNPKEGRLVKHGPNIGFNRRTGFVKWIQVYKKGKLEKNCVRLFSGYPADKDKPALKDPIIECRGKDY